MDAKKTIEATEETLKKYLKNVANNGLVKPVQKHDLDFTEDLRVILSLLTKLKHAIVRLKPMIDQFPLSVSIREVTNFHNALGGFITECQTLPKSSGNLSDRLDTLRRSLQDHLQILLGKKPPSPDGWLEKAIGKTMYLTDPTPHESIAKAIMKWTLRLGAVKIKGAVGATSKSGAKQLFETLYTKVNTLVIHKEERFTLKLKLVKSRLDHFKDEHLIEHVGYIEEETEKLHFRVNEVEDLKKVLDQGIGVCSTDFCGVYNPEQTHNDLHKLDKSLQEQTATLKSKVLRGHHNR